jgi:signal transduction histidine kinase
MFIESIIAFFLLWHLRRRLKTTPAFSDWDKNLKLAMVSVAALFAIEFFFHVEPVTTWIWHLLLIAIILGIHFNPAFNAARALMFAVLPFILLSFFNDLFKLLFREEYKVIDDYIDVAIFFSVIWMIAMLIIEKKQRNALEKERLKTQAEEELNLKLAEQKAQLENLVEERTYELVQQKNELEKALDELKATQNQLIHQEKLASLGELTAGIAHEIQNPLNFVNNFSEVNTELVDELHNAIDEGNLIEVRSIANDIKENEQKIVYHGKRADVIVKSMLHHSRSSSGVNEPTDINVLTDEYLRLAYHGLRAKDKSFNATLKTDFDVRIEKINIIPQDIGRVILNLITNAFYAVAEKKNASAGSAGQLYEPTVSVSTKKVNGKVELKVKDNGLGMPGHVIDKIFQPFFTTKPTGQGTGLGLSISYDIVKAHGGELKVETKEGEGTEFIIQIPIV